MPTQLIKTQKGLTTDHQAFDKIKEPGYSPALQISILTQLGDINPILAHEGAAWIVSNSSEKENSKVIRTAKEILSGLPIGIKYLSKKEQYAKFFSQIPAGSNILLKFKGDKIRDIATLIHGSRRCLTFNQVEVTIFMSCVVTSGRWEGVSKTFHATVCDMRGSDLELLAHDTTRCVDTVELLYTLEQFARAYDGGKTPMQKKLDALMEKNTDVEYDADLFLETVDALKYPQARAWVEKFAPNEPLQNVIDCFLSDFGRLEFFRAYALKFQLLMES